MTSKNLMQQKFLVIQRTLYQASTYGDHIDIPSPTHIFNAHLQPYPCKDKHIYKNSTSRYQEYCS